MAPLVGVDLEVEDLEVAADLASAPVLLDLVEDPLVELVLDEL